MYPLYKLSLTFRLQWYQTNTDPKSIGREIRTDMMSGILWNEKYLSYPGGKKRRDRYIGNQTVKNLKIRL